MASKKTDFESSMKELAEIVEKLESGDCSLDESINLFERGMKLSSDCTKVLENARQKIVSLTQAESEERDDG